MLMVAVRRTDVEYGHAEFAAGQGEVDDTPIISTSTVAAAPAKTGVVPPVVPVPETDAATESAEWSVLQKGLFLAVILGCIAIWMKVGNNKRQKRYPEKSMA
jgi:peptidyl-prolyl cis-trans isomerase B (cyclophilin B)